MRKIIFLFLIIGELFIVGCVAAPSKEHPAVYKSGFVGVPMHKNVGIQINEIKDVRGGADPKLINDGFVLNEPLADTIQNALQIKLKQQGYKITNSAKYAIKGEIVNLHYVALSSDVFDTMYGLLGQFNFIVINNETKKEVMNKQCAIGGSYYASERLPGSSFDRVFSRTIDRLLICSIGSRDFHQATK